MSEVAVQSPALYMQMAKRELIQIALLGAGVGVIVWVLTSLFDTYLYHAVLCQATASDQCTSASTYASITGTIIAAFLGLMGLVRLRLFRPLLVVIAAMISLWGLNVLLGDIQWYWALVISIGMYTLAYCAFAWIARLTNFYAALAGMIVLTVIVRLVLT